VTQPVTQPQVPYHNRKHAACVMHGVYYLLTQRAGLLGAAATPAALFKFIVAAAMHDAGHDGRNNAYHSNTWDEVAGAEFGLLYSDQSPLERHHCATGFRVMRDTGLFAALPADTRKDFRRSVVTMVLSTDMAQHAKMMVDFQLLLNPSVPAGGGGGGDASPTKASTCARNHQEASASGLPLFSSSAELMTAAEAMTIACMVLKMGDLSNPTKGFDYYMVWTDRCLEEFMEQGEREKERALPVGYDRATVEAWKAKGQVGLFTFLVRPMFQAFDALVPMTEQLEAIDEAIDYWKGKLDAPPAAAAEKI